MKVGIVTLPLHTNYGGILQAWALQTAIGRMGHEASHVFRHLLGPLVLHAGMTADEIAAFQRHTARFVDRYVRCDETPVAEIAPDRYDALVVGSDQIWRNRYAEFFHIGIRNAFLDFAKGWSVKRWPRKGELRAGLCVNGLFSMTDNYEGMEFSLGGDGYRPIVNCAMESEARAISEIARLAGDAALSERYAAKAAALAQLIRTRLWNAERQFFTVLSPEERLASVRELCGYAPWYFGLKLDASYDGVWRHLMREDGFLAPWGLTFPERTALGFEISYEGHDCLWNGPSWPYATSLALTALANRLQAGEGVPGGLTASSFAFLLRQYAAAHVFVKPDGTEVPWIDENQNPFTGDWIARTKLIRGKSKIRERGKDYNHSTFCDLVIGGLCGFRPRRDGALAPKPLAPAEWDWWCLDGVRYHGKDVAILFDRDGKRYGKGTGLVVLKDNSVNPHRWRR